MNRKCVFLKESLRIAFAVILLCISGAVIAGSSEVSIEMTGTVTGGGTCSVNNDKVIEISFGDVPIEEIDGIDSYYQPVPLTVTCSGSASTSVSIAIRGNVTPWDRNSIVTSTDGLGIRHWIHVPGLYMDPAPTGGFNIVALNDIPTLIIHAVLNKQSGKTLTPQEFSATATLLVNYE